MLKVNRQTLNLAIPIEVETDDGIESAYLHAAPLDSQLFNEFAGDLAATIGQVFEGNPMLIASEFLSMVEAHIIETRGEDVAKKRIERLNKILLAEITSKGRIVSSFSDFEPVTVGEALDAGLITLDDLEMAESKYLFFSRALRVSRSLVLSAVGSRLSAKEFGLEISLSQRPTEATLSYPQLSDSETSGEKVTASCTDASTDLQDLAPAYSPEKTQRKTRVTGQSFGK